MGLCPGLSWDAVAVRPARGRIPAASCPQCKDFFAKSLFVVGELAGNDYNAPLFAGKDLREAYNLIPHVVQGISDGVEQLIAEGAKDLIVPGVMPSGCFPVYLSMYVDPKEGYGPRSGCLKRFNTFSWVHNAMLKRALEKLRAKHPGVRIVYGDYFTPVIQFLLQPEKFDLPAREIPYLENKSEGAVKAYLYNIKAIKRPRSFSARQGPNITAVDVGFHKQPPRACCGAPGKGPYNFNLTAKCGEPGATPCADPKTHWSWDGIHLTEAAYGHIAKVSDLLIKVHYGF
uniref:GDSL esterase/lipase n=1 Tax=Aegilops tauschii TaxID=37682 RepID=R7W0D0_AEGTA